METCKRCECRLQKNVKQKLLTKTTSRGYCLLNGIRFYKSTIPLITFSVSRKYVSLKYLFLNKTKHLSLNFQRSKWLCRCGEKEKEAHITSGSCPIYDDIWEKRADLKITMICSSSSPPCRRGGTCWTGWKKKTEMHRPSAIAYVQDELRHICFWVRQTEYFHGHMTVDQNKCESCTTGQI